MPGLENLHFHFSESPEPAEPPRSRTAEARPSPIWSGSTEDAARYYLHQLLGKDTRPSLRGVALSADAQLVPGLAKEKAFEIPWPFDKARNPVRRGSGTGKPSGRATSLVRFRQVHGEIPVFGSSAVVELDESRKLISADVNVADLSEVPREPKLSEEDARHALAGFVTVPLEKLGPVRGSLVYVHDRADDRWRLAWLYQKVPASPPPMAAPGNSPGELTGESPRQMPPRFDYLVDAGTGRVLRWYGSAPALREMAPAGCNGRDEDGASCAFLGRRIAAPPCIEMHDELHRLITMDNAMKSYDTHPQPEIAVRCGNANFGQANAAAVSAHINGGKVIAFYRAVLGRSGIDDEQMVLVSVVNNTAHDGYAPEWKQAQWYDNKMWYGQYRDGQGNLKSYARHLDIVAHELTHGVTEYSSGLKYWGQSGALDESFADLFGVTIDNVSRLGNNSTADQWSWQIGSGLGQNGGPLRDLTAPSLTNLSQFVATMDDWGGVHTLSGIHSKAAYDVFTARDAAGKLLLGWMEAIVIYYVSLCRLPPEADFLKARATIADFAKTFFSGLPDGEQQARLTAIENAYQQVGIA
ncbi:MAG: M4 family metallopeptidase [Acidobacteriia bacterium]|nr:M4 family metallopeptidase [Terriglobia bacterium]